MRKLIFKRVPKAGIRRIFFTSLVLLSISFFCAIPASSNPQALFSEANQLFEKGDVDRALDQYQSLIRQGFEGTALFYNLGNIYYRKGERGRAILWYERAKSRAPRDADIQFNLSLAKSHLRDEKESVIQNTVFYFTNWELGWFVTFLMWVFFGLWGAKIIGWAKGDLWLSLVLWFTGVLLVPSLVWFVVNTSWRGQPVAIVTTPPGEVRNGPGGDYAVGFTVPEGSKVLVLNQRPEWVQIGVPQQGLKGWIPAAEVEFIEPRRPVSST